MKLNIRIDGMTCDHCVKRVAQALEELPGVAQVQVRLAEHDAIVEAEAEIPRDKLDAVIADAGFEVKGVSAA